VILDEATYAMTWGWIDTDEVVATLRDRPPHVTVIVTGRDAPDALIDAADTVTEMRKVKHAFDAGISARRGIDF
jgi:cob(I)alamin adenosyltransferase